MKRFWEIDLLRGLAVIFMIIFNYLFALNFLQLIKFPIYSFVWQVVARLTAGIFFWLVGCCMTISWSRASKRLDKQGLWKKYLARSGKIFGLGMLITLATWLFLQKGFVKFGALHFIGLSVFISFLLLALGIKKKIALLLAIATIGIGIFLLNVDVRFPWLFWLGLKSKNFYSLDYFPIFPWFGVVLFGIAGGKAFYLGSRRKFYFPEISNPISQALCFLGRNSLVIYLFHQPALFAILWLCRFPFF